MGTYFCGYIPLYDYRGGWFTRMDSKHQELSKRKDVGLLHCMDSQAAIGWVFSTFAIDRVISGPSRARLPVAKRRTVWAEHMTGKIGEESSQISVGEWHDSEFASNTCLPGCYSFAISTPRFLPFSWILCFRSFAYNHIDSNSAFYVTLV